MCISRRVRDLIVGVMAWLACVATVRGEEVERVVLAEDLANPTAIVSHQAKDGGVRVLVAESGSGQLTEFNLLGERVFGREVIGRLPNVDITGLASLDDRRLLLGRSGFTAIDLADDAAEMKPPTGKAVLGPPAINDRWLFAPGQEGLLRARLGQGRITRLRPIPIAGSTPLAVAFSPEGYLVLLAGAESEGHQLVFCDPNEPGVSASSYPLKGLNRPIALAYLSTPLEPPALLVLEGSADGDAGEAGLYRIEIAFENQKPAAIARLLAPIDGPTGMTILPDGEVVVTTSDGERGSLLRLTLPK